MSNRLVSTALISVSDKTGLADFAAGLHARHVRIYSTGGTAKVLEAAGIPCTQVSELTQFPEMMGGRVKTLHPKIYGGILARLDIDEADLQAHDIPVIDLVVCNLYPFSATIAKPQCSQPEALENIDIGGPCMIRAAAKNFPRVNVIVDPTDYATCLKQLEANHGSTTVDFRKQLAHKAYAHTALYDQTISTYLDSDQADDSLDNHHTLTLTRQQTLRYGENPHQKAALYTNPELSAQGCLATAPCLQGKALSYNNLADAHAALSCVRLFEKPACVIVKHANPCGVAIADDVLSAYQRAYQTDSTSSFGGIIAFNRPVDETLAQTMINQQFVEVVLAPEFTDAARQVFSTKRHLRLLALGELHPAARHHTYHAIDGGILVQDSDQITVHTSTLNCVTQRQPSEQERSDLIFAWKVAAITKSNAIVLAKDGATVGIGAGQMSRIDSTKIALRKAQEAGLETKGCALASDAFFPFPDNITLAAEHGIKCVIQPGGSIRDQLVNEAADTLGVAMLLTGTRHFRH